MDYLNRNGTEPKPETDQSALQDANAFLNNLNAVPSLKATLRGAEKKNRGNMNNKQVSKEAPKQTAMLPPKQPVNVSSPKSNINGTSSKPVANENQAAPSIKGNPSSHKVNGSSSKQVAIPKFEQRTQARSASSSTAQAPPSDDAVAGADCDAPLDMMQVMRTIKSLMRSNIETGKEMRAMTGRISDLEKDNKIIKEKAIVLEKENKSAREKASQAQTEVRDLARKFSELINIIDDISRHEVHGRVKTNMKIREVKAQILPMWDVMVNYINLDLNPLQ